MIATPSHTSHSGGISTFTRASMTSGVKNGNRLSTRVIVVAGFAMTLSATISATTIGRTAAIIVCPSSSVLVQVTATTAKSIE